jgi:hypothetical protein
MQARGLAGRFSSNRPAKQHSMATWVDKQRGLALEPLKGGVKPVGTTGRISVGRLFEHVGFLMYSLSLFAAFPL